MKVTDRPYIRLCVAVVVCVVGIAGCSDKPDEPTVLILQSPAFEAGDRIPIRHTGDGEDVSPPLRWSNVPDGTRELALIVDDPDAPTSTAWVHWVIYKIPANLAALPEGAAPGAIEGLNGWNTRGYRGPAPPRGHGVHHYHFRLYALDAKLTISAGADKAELLRAMAGHILAETELIGTYQR